MKHTKYTIFMLISIMFIFSPSFLWADENNIVVGLAAPEYYQSEVVLPNEIVDIPEGVLEFMNKHPHLFRIPPDYRPPRPPVLVQKEAPKVHPLPALSPRYDVPLETTAFKIVHSAFQVGEYDTVQNLFQKLSWESKKQFLQEATAMANINIAELGKSAPSTVMEVDALAEGLHTGSFSNYVAVKTEQVKLLGKLAVSLLDEEREMAVARSEERFMMGRAPEFDIRQSLPFSLLQQAMKAMEAMEVRR